MGIFSGGDISIPIVSVKKLLALNVRYNRIPREIKPWISCFSAGLGDITFDAPLSQKLLPSNQFLLNIPESSNITTQLLHVTVNLPPPNSMFIV